MVYESIPHERQDDKATTAQYIRMLTKREKLKHPNTSKLTPHLFEEREAVKGERLITPPKRNVTCPPLH